MKKIFTLAISIAITGNILISCAPSASSGDATSSDTLTEQDREVIQYLFDNEDSLSDEEVDSIIEQHFGNGETPVVSSSVN